MHTQSRRPAEIAWAIARFVILSGLCFIILYPLIYMVSCAFRTRADMNDPTVMWIPRHLTLDIIRETWKAMDFSTTLQNTLILNVGCSLVQVVTCAFTGYGFARFRFKGQKLLWALVLMQILVPSQVLSGPQYMEFRYCLGLEPLMQKIAPTAASNFNLINTPLPMYLPAVMGNGIRAGLMIFLFRQFFRGLPRELEDAAYLDGCGPFQTFLRVMVPNSGSIFLTVFLFSVVWYWNDFYVSSTFFTNNTTLALMLKNLSTRLSLVLWGSANVEISPREQIIWMEAGCLLAVTPLLVLYVCLQKYFTEGIERSGLVG